MKKLLKELCLAFGPSGLECKVREIIERELRASLSDNAEIFYDALGGIYYHIKNEGAPRLMLSAHLDEVGFMVTEISDTGMLKFGNVGGINPLTLLSKRVVSEKGVRGFITSKPIHLQNADERKARVEIADMRINIGASNKQEALSLVDIGEYFTFDSEFCELGDNLIKAKAIDDRHGCTALLSVIKELSKNGASSEYDLYFAFTCREEIGMSGAWCATELIKPDFAVVVESKAVYDLPSASDDECVAKLGDGALISYADNGAIMDRGLTEKITDLCEKNDIKYQISRAVSGGNDTSAIQRGARGTRVALISAPSRYIHSSANVIDYTDFECICRALLALCIKTGEKK